ncbi:calpain clp-1 [Sodiomyces alkalinus F11]|uniref:Calpain clp-1 n=1 Tax=Sodiomyces alkalinus (strain CBS 110278 / VKM F-3762 / F11) TaxID=1314773 RepID=A0A3N2PUF6_SODAK|nr:calpain clp-1 [Sodiomyces alkalinus F11]ROT38139.1 calpain clp-1 [Sodiomyces alkalinus F11]
MHGYSSSEESDDPRRPRAQPSTSSSNSNDQKKKKKKPKPPPQQTINWIWKNFQKRKFSKALAVLPFDPVLPPAGPERPNESPNAGYERAAEECRRKVRKIIQECRRVNTRYRDPNFDLDWDLKWEKGNCLNHLGSTKWSISRSSLSSSSATVPKAVKRVHEIFEKPTFMKSLSGDDVKQGSLGDCWLIASLTALAHVPGALEKICVEYDQRIGIYGFVFYRGMPFHQCYPFKEKKQREEEEKKKNEKKKKYFADSRRPTDGEWIYSIIDDKLYLKSPAWDSRSMQRDLLQQIDREDQERVYRKTYQTGSKALFFGQCKDQNETWVPLLEKAYAKAHGDYASLIGGWIGEALEDLSGGVTSEILVSDILDTESFWDELARVNDEFLFGCSTGLLECGYGDRDGISEGHAYVLMEAKTLKSGQRLLKLRNPWGKIRKGIWEGAWSDGSKEWTPDAQAELNHMFGNDSSFWISYEDFLNKFQHIDRTRLFRDTDWRCCQRWIGVEAPWKPQYNEKLQFTLTKDSPLVLTLTQLDDRYFKGLQGQYRFRLHFRIHEKGRPEAEDYVVRSHGNYLMSRGVSIEIPDMPAGEYSVFISVTAERDTAVPSVENVVKRECKNRTENEKLAQVGYAYDLAHSKGAAHLEEVARLRKIKDQQKASASRQKERRKQWERRHMNRVINKKQKEKNTTKRERKRAAAAVDDADESSTEEEVKQQPEQQQQQAADQSKEEGKADGQQESDEKPASPKPKKGEGKRRATKAAPPPPVSDGESSDSPIEDWEELYSSDDMVRKPRLAPAQPPLPKSAIFESEDEDAPEPWNAICIVGFRLYSKDEDLDLRVVMEGGDLLENGMGKKGGADLDNAQENAGGEREKQPSGEEEAEEKTAQQDAGETKAASGGEKGEVVDGDAKAPPSPPEEPKEREKGQQPDETGADKTPEPNEDSKSDKSSDSAEYDKLDSGASTPGVLVTPMESGKQLG